MSERLVHIVCIQNKQTSSLSDLSQTNVVSYAHVTNVICEEVDRERSFALHYTKEDQEIFLFGSNMLKPISELQGLTSLIMVLKTCEAAKNVQSQEHLALLS